MRGSALIFHSIDPESLDRIEDFESLDPESDDDDPYREIDEMLSASQQSQPKSHHSYYGQSSRLHESGHHEKKNLGQSKSVQVSGSRSSLPMFNPLSTNLSSSPVTKSNYYQDDSKDSQSTNNHANEIMKRFFHNQNSNNNHMMNQDDPHHQIDGMNKEKTLTSSGSGMPLSRVKSWRNEIPNSNEKFSDDEEASNHTGLTRFLHSLDFIDKIRQHKAEKNRLNVYNLPPQLREELKHIYVY